MTIALIQHPVDKPLGRFRKVHLLLQAEYHVSIFVLVNIYTSLTYSNMRICSLRLSLRASSLGSAPSFSQERCESRCWGTYGGTLRWMTFRLVGTKERCWRWLPGGNGVWAVLQVKRHETLMLCRFALKKMSLLVRFFGDDIVRVF